MISTTPDLAFFPGFMQKGGTNSQQRVYLSNVYNSNAFR